MEPKEEVNSLSLKMVKFVKMIIFHSLFFQTSYLFYFTLVYISKMEFKLLRISSVYNSVFLLSEICVLHFSTCHCD